MNLFFNISHPAHFHFFKNAIFILNNRGHKIIIGVRNKEFTVKLLNSLNNEYFILTNKGNGFFGLLKELIIQQFKIARITKKKSINLMLQISGIFNAPVGKLYHIPTIAISDTENDKIGNKISFSLSKHVLSPTCFDHKYGGTWKNQIHYPGYHELAYLTPKYFKKEIKPSNKFLLRFVGWGAGHDIGEKRLSDKQKIELTTLLKKYGEVYISSEANLPQEIEQHAYKFHPAEIHDFMAGCKMIIGESATMASEAACMGIPAIFISNTGRGYTTEQEKKYDLIKHYTLQQWNEIINTIKYWAQKDLFNEWQNKRWNMLKDKIEVTDWLVDLIENYPGSIKDAKQGKFENYSIQQ